MTVLGLVNAELGLRRVYSLKHQISAPSLIASSNVGESCGTLRKS